MKLRWFVPAGPQPRIPVLQFWQSRLRAGEAAGLDYSEDGEWVNVPVVLELPEDPPRPPNL